MPVAINWAGFSPTMGTQGANVASTAGQLVDGSSHIEKKVSQLMRRPQFRALRKLLRTLNGNAAGAGGNVVDNYGRVRAQVALADSALLGGSVPVDNTPRVGTTVAGRVTATADQTQLNAMIDEIVYPSTYINDASGNGGGGKLGF